MGSFTLVLTLPEACNCCCQTADTIEAVFSSIPADACSPCTPLVPDHPEFGTSRQVVSHLLNGAQTLTKTSAPGATTTIWELVIASGFTTEAYVSPDCSGAPYLIIAQPLTVRLKCAGSGYWVEASPVFNTNPLVHGYFRFDETGINDGGSCAGTVTLSL